MRPVTPTLPDPELNHGEKSLVAFLSHTRLIWLRLVRSALRDRNTLAQALVYPALTLAMFDIVLGDTVTQVTRTESIYGYVSMLSLVGAMSGATVAAVYLQRDIADGLAARIQTLPIHRAAPLAGQLLAEATRIALTTAILVAAGYAFGFRFNEGILSALAFVLVPVLFGIGFAMFVAAIATIDSKLPMVETVGMATTLLMFFNTGFVPAEAYPSWLQATVENQPMSCAIDTMRALALGEGPIAIPLIKTLAWTAGLLAVFTLPAVRGYARAARR